MIHIITTTKSGTVKYKDIKLTILLHFNEKEIRIQFTYNLTK